MLLWCWPEHTVEKTVNELTVIPGAMTSLKRVPIIYIPSPINCQFVIEFVSEWSSYVYWLPPKHEHAVLNPSFDRNIPVELINTRAADALASCDVRTSAAVVLTTPGEQILIFHEETYPVSAPSKFWGMLENAAIVLCLFKGIQWNEG